MRLVPLIVALGLLSVSVAGAVLIATGDGSENSTPPVEQPGFGNVGIVDGLSGVYVRNGWVLTTNHVGEHPIKLNGILYESIPGSQVRFENADGSPADLIAFKLTARPVLPDLTLTDAPAARDTLVTLIGNSRDRGPVTTWMNRDGWSWGVNRTIRWGTNRMSTVDVFVLGTRSFWIEFDELPVAPPGEHEADIVDGDSGGAAFVGSGEAARLAGILFARSPFPGQPASTSLYGDRGVIVDLFYYAADIAALIDVPDCADGLDDDGDGLIDAEDPGCDDPSDPDEFSATLVCDNGLDDDGDGLIDGADPGCDDASDLDERGDALVCDNGLDDDGDGKVDGDDPGCDDPSDPDEASAALVCDNGLDDDGDGLVDLADPGCEDPSDPDESSALLACDNGLDDDGDGLIDLADPGCDAPGDPDERGAAFVCDNGLDDDGDGLVDLADPGCDGPSDPDELDPIPACDNGLDDDGDGLIDGADPGCDDPSDPSERGALFQCDNGLDDDGDGLIDFPDDDGCLHPTGLVEAPEPSGAVMLEIGVLALSGLPKRR